MLAAIQSIYLLKSHGELFGKVRFKPLYLLLAWLLLLLNLLGFIS